MRGIAVLLSHTRVVLAIHSGGPANNRAAFVQLLNTRVTNKGFVIRKMMHSACVPRQPLYVQSCGRAALNSRPGAVRAVRQRAALNPRPGAIRAVQHLSERGVNGSETTNEFSACDNGHVTLLWHVIKVI